LFFVRGDRLPRVFILVLECANHSQAIYLAPVNCVTGMPKAAYQNGKRPSTVPGLLSWGWLPGSLIQLLGELQLGQMLA
jgi:hypothetical protein